MTSPSDSATTSRPARRGRIRIALILSGFALIGTIVWLTQFRTPYAEREFARATRALEDRDWERALESARRLDAAGAADRAALVRAEHLLAFHRPEDALRELNAIPPQSPVHLRAAGRAGRCLLQLGEIRAAHEVFTRVVEKDPDDADAHRGLASIAYDLGQMPTALHHLERVAVLDGADPRPHRLMGLIYKDMNQPDQADAAYREAIRRGLTGEARNDVAIELAQTRLDAREFAEALAAVEAADFRDDDPAAAAIRIEALRGLGERGKALALADRFVDSAPADGVFFRLRGQLHLDADQLPSAIADLERAAAQAPAHYQTQFLLAQAYAAAGRGPDAAKAKAKADALHAALARITELTAEAVDRPWDASVRLRLAEAAEELGKPKLAAMWRAAARTCSQPAR